MNIDYTPLPESHPRVKFHLLKFALIFFIWTIVLFLIWLIGSFVNNAIIVNLAMNAWFGSVVLVLIFWPVALIIFLFLKGREFETNTFKYLSSFSYYNGWSFIQINEDFSSESPYMPPASKNLPLKSYSASRLWEIDAKLKDVPVQLIGLRYFKHSIGPGHFAPHHITVLRVPVSPRIKIIESKNVSVEQNNEYYYVYRDTITVTQSEVKSLLSSAEVS